jgi:hypothetical protein
VELGWGEVAVGGVGPFGVVVEAPVLEVRTLNTPRNRTRGTIETLRDQ